MKKRKYIKTVAAVIIICLTLQAGGVLAHDFGVVSDVGIDYEMWEKETPPPAVMPTPEPTPTPTPTPTPAPTPKPPVKFKEVEIARASTVYETYAAQANRNNNMYLAAKAIDYAVIPNGEVFSFNNTVGPRTAARGYKEATIFVGDEKEQGLGGGICQVSSTVYMAAKKARLKILERYPHTLPVTYCMREDEATVSWGRLDFRFSNNTGDPIRLEASCRGGIIRVIIYQRVPVYN